VKKDKEQKKFDGIYKITEPSDYFIKPPTVQDWLNYSVGEQADRYYEMEGKTIRTWSRQNTDLNTLKTIVEKSLEKCNIYSITAISSKENVLDRVVIRLSAPYTFGPWEDE